MASSFLQRLVDPKKNFLARLHMKSVSNRLRKYGLRYDDLYDPMYDLDINEALNRLPREVVDARNQRLKRAMDLSMKHEYLPDDLQAVQTPFRSYLQEMLALVSHMQFLVKRERAEREALGALPLYQRTIP
uniref:Cytochrome b-c1 complex subunit 7 n=1 Tax=Brassica oleracea var. oleracea TaxID=109376 RepID=A0A0D3AXN4_BRAOL